jgi:hypothetical protein
MIVLDRGDLELKIGRYYDYSARDRVGLERLVDDEAIISTYIGDWVGDVL